jgi:hypothetical protein
MMQRQILALGPMGIAVNDHDDLQESRTAAAIAIPVERGGDAGIVLRPGPSGGAGLPDRALRGMTAKTVIFADGAEGIAAGEPSAACGPAGQTGWHFEFEALQIACGLEPRACSLTGSAPT